MADELPWFKCNPTEWLQSCMDMEPEEFGFYARLILFMYSRGGLAPYDEAKLRHIWNCSKQAARKMRDRLLAAQRIERAGDNLTQSRVKKELRIAKKLDALIAESEVGSGEKTDENLAKNEEKLDKNEEKTPELFSDNSLKTNDPEKQIPDTRVHIEIPTPYGAMEAMDDWNALAEEFGLRKSLKLTADRKKHISARLKDHGEPGWKRALIAVRANRFYLGENDRGWKATIDYVANPNKFVRLLESAPDQSSSDAGAKVSDEAWRIVMRRWVDRGSWDGEGDAPDGRAGRCQVPQHILDEFNMPEQGGQLRLVAGQ